jgi:hypothetical protein
MDTIDPERLAALCQEDYGAEELRVVAGRLYLYIPTDASRSKLSNNFLEKKLKITATTRNRKTLARLIELAEALSPRLAPPIYNKGVDAGKQESRRAPAASPSLGHDGASQEAKRSGSLP